MAIVSSSYVTDTHSQAGGGRWTVEFHTDSIGKSYMCGPYLWDGVANRDTLLALHAEQLASDLANAESEAVLGE
jgi:hypothetical protein